MVRILSTVWQVHGYFRYPESRHKSRTAYNKLITPLFSRQNYSSVVGFSILIDRENFSTHSATCVVHMSTGLIQQTTHSPAEEWRRSLPSPYAIRPNVFQLGRSWNTVNAASPTTISQTSPCCTHTHTSPRLCMCAHASTDGQLYLHQRIIHTHPYVQHDNTCRGAVDVDTRPPEPLAISILINLT